MEFSHEDNEDLQASSIDPGAGWGIGFAVSTILPTVSPLS